MSEIECRKSLLESSSMGSSSSKSKNKFIINNHDQRQQQQQQQSSFDGNKAEDNLRIGRDDDDNGGRKWECSTTAEVVIELISTSTANHHIDELSASNKRPDAETESESIQPAQKYQKHRCKATTSKSNILDNNTTTTKAINLYDNCKSEQADDANCQTISDTLYQRHPEERISAASAADNLTASSSAVAVECEVNDESQQEQQQQLLEASTSSASAALVKVKTWETATVCKPATPKKEF